MRFAIGEILVHSCIREDKARPEVPALDPLSGMGFLERLRRAVVCTDTTHIPAQWPPLRVPAGQVTRRSSPKSVRRARTRRGPSARDRHRAGSSAAASVSSSNVANSSSALR